MNKFNVVAASAVALTAALASGSALAHGTLAVTTATYNAASVTAAGGTITVPWGSTASVVYTVIGPNNTATTSLEVNSRFTVTLPTGFSFASAPAITVTGTSAGETMPLLNGGIGQQTATFVVGPNQGPILANSQLSLGAVSVQGATALETPGAALSVTVQSTNNAQVANNDLAPVVATTVAFASDSGLISSISGPSPFAFVDLTSPTLGTLFFQGSSPDTTTADIGTIHLSSSNSLSATGVPLPLSTSDTATLTVNGLFNGIASAFAGPAGSCATSVATGAVTASTITISSLPEGNFTADICIVANGTTLLPQNAAGFTANYAAGSGVTDFLGSVVTGTLAPVSYTGGQVVGASSFFTGSDAGYTSLLRVTNGGTASTSLFAVAQPYSGGLPLVGSLGTIGAGMGTVFSEAQIGTATGLSLANSGDRATLQIIATPASLVTASSLLVNPGGVVDNVN